MPSDPRALQALDALRAPIESYRAAVAAALAQVTDFLAAHRAPTVDRTELAATALGRFAGGRVDARRFAATFEAGRVLSAEDVARLERCAATLQELAARGDDLFVRELPAGADLEREIGAALAEVGRAFGAVLAFQALRTGVYRDDVHAPLLAAFPFERWNRAERQVAPPLVLSVEGADLEAPRIARYLDGRVRIALLVRGPAAPAALVSLLTPGVLALQAADVAQLAGLTAAPGAAIAAIVGADAAHFRHDPAGGPRLCDRLAVQALPTERPRQPVGRCSAAQLVEQLAQLQALAAAARAESQLDATQAMGRTEAVAAAVAASGDAQAVDTLAGWLLTQAGLVEGAGR